VIREAAGADAIPLAEIYVASWREAYRGIAPDSALEALSVATQTARWQKLLSGAARNRVRAFVVDEDGALAGFIVVGDVRGDVPDPRRREVQAMYLDPRLWRKGLGRRLLAHAEKDARESGAVVMVNWILAANRRGQAFCEALGYNPTGETRTNSIGGVPVEEAKWIRSLEGASNPG